MKYIIIILLNSFLFISLLKGEGFCSVQANCIVEVNDEGRDSDILSCSLKNMNNLTVYAPHVLTKEGELKEYWSDKKTVCNVMEWMNDNLKSLSKMDGVINSFDKPTILTLNMIHSAGTLTGNSYINSNLYIDIDKKNEKGIEYVDKFSLEECDFEKDDICESSSDGNDLEILKKFQVVHEMFHFIQDKTALKLKHKWVNEGTARMFEDVVYDINNSYMKKEYTPFYRAPYIPNILENLTSEKTAYKTFAFWKLIQEKCTLDMKKMLNNPLQNLNTMSESCTKLPNIIDDKLANLFFYYNWAILYKEDFSLIDEGEPSVNLFQRRLEIVNQKEFQKTLDMKNKIGSFVPKYGAKSFIINADVISKSNKEGNLTLSIKTDKPLTVVGIRLNSNNESRITEFNDKFDFITKTNIIKEYNLTEEDREGGLFVTLLNTTEEEINILDMNLTYKRFSRDDEHNIVTDHERGLMWQDETDTWLDSWYGARRHCTALTLGDYGDWRVPTYDELIHILDLDGEDSYRYEIFEHLGPVGYWSLDRNGGVFPGSESARVVNFGLATWIWINTSSQMNTRCVRTK
jgi:hypothetical protein